MSKPNNPDFDEQQRTEIKFTQVFQGQTTVLGNKLHYPQTQTPQLALWKVRLPANSVGDWHEHLVPEFFYVDSGTLYVANQRQDGQIDLVKFGPGDVGLTDINVPQFIWNPTESETVVTALYLSEDGKPATKNLGGKPNAELLQKLFKQALTPNKTQKPE